MKPIPIPMLIAAGVALGGFSVLQGCGEEKPTVVSSGHMLKIEAAGVHLGGWPLMRVLVNDTEIATLTVDNPKRETFEFDVPASVGDIATVEVRMTEGTDCGASDVTMAGTCVDRTLTVRSLMLDDQKIENPIASGTRNSPYSLQDAEGGIVWQVKQ